jgi:hypothetical protein
MQRNHFMPGLPDFPLAPDDNPLILTGKEKKTMAGFEAQISVICQQKLSFLREAARKKGITAATLDDLKSKSGEPFVEEKEKKTWGREYRLATVTEDSPITGKSMVTETAYFCCDMFSVFSKENENSDGCGWVKGQPIQKAYDDIGVLSGSAGYNIFCKICGKLIAQHKIVMS